MATVLDEPAPSPTAAGDRLRESMAAARLSFTWLGVRKTLTADQKNQAANPFGAEGKYLSAGKKLLDTSHHAFKAVTAVRSQAVAYWKGISVPFPEPGIRLIRRDSIESFDQRIISFREELELTVAELNRHFDDLKDAARNRLGDLFNRDDYPTTLVGMFSIEHEYPSVEPPDYLRRLNPVQYEQECRRMQSRFDDAVQLAEQAFFDEIAKLVEHLADRLNGDADGKPKVFRDTAISNFTEFFERFRSLNIRSNEQLDELVNRAQRLLSGVQPQQLRDSDTLRQQISTQLASVQSSLDGLLVDRPRRNIQRRPR